MGPKINESKGEKRLSTEIDFRGKISRSKKHQLKRGALLMEEASKDSVFP